MTARKMLAIGSLLLLLTFLASALRVYDSRQEALALEGDRLYSADAFSIEANARDVLTETTGVVDDLRVFKDITEDSRVRAVLTADGTTLPVPVHEGRAFTADDTPQALVGAAVGTTSDGGVTRYAYGGREYGVVGRLGLRADSLLSGDVLLHDPTLFAAEGTERLVVDGRDARDRYVAAFGGDRVSALTAGTSRRTDVDFVSTLLLLFGTCVLGVGLALTGVLAGALLRDHTHVRHVLGASYGSIFLRAAGPLLLLWLAAAAVSTAFWATRPGGSPAPGAPLWPDLAWQVGTLTVAFTLAFVTGARAEAARWS